MIKLEKNIDHIRDYLNSRSGLHEGEEIEKIEVPGDGNMNFTLRVITNQRSFIIKQSREYVEKYPQVPAPPERSQREAEFYQIIADEAFLNDRTPSILNVDAENSIITMTDLGKGNDFTYLYGPNKKLPLDELNQILDFAIVLHKKTNKDQSDVYIRNIKMRKLNHEHIFVYPFMEDNGMNLDDVLPGLADVARVYQEDEDLKKKVSALGEKYLEDGSILLHGDYFMGSWLRTEDGVKIIDPEFCFFGFPEFEIGVMIGHLMMADLPSDTVDYLLNYYTEKAPLNQELTMKYASIEIMRRIMGLAQLPLTIDLTQRKELLQFANNTLKN